MLAVATAGSRVGQRVQQTAVRSVVSSVAWMVDLTVGLMVAQWDLKLAGLRAVGLVDATAGSKAVRKAV